MALKELNSLRTRTMKVFDKAPGERVYRCHTRNLHYPDSSKIMQDIDTIPIPRVGGYYADKNVSKYEIPDRANGLFSFYNQDHFFDLKIVGVSSTVQAFPLGGYTLRYQNIFGDGIHLDVMFVHNGMLKWIIFEKPPKDIKKDFDIDYEILAHPDVFQISDQKTPHNYSNLSVASNTGKLTNKNIKLFSSTGGKNVSYIAKTGCINSHPSPVRLPIGLTFYRQGGKLYLRKTIPKEIFIGAHYPIYADDPAVYTTDADDSLIIYDTLAAWDTAHDATSGDAYTADFGELTAGPYHSGGNYKLSRLGIPVDTSAIADGDTVTATDFYVYGADYDVSGEIAVVGISGSVSKPLADADFNNIGSAVDNPTEFATRIGQAAWDMAGWNTFAYNANGLASINKTGITWACMRSGSDCDDSAPGASQRFGIEDSAAGANDAYLDVTASAGGISIPVVMHHLTKNIGV